MRKILIATHGSFAKGLQETLQFIIGAHTNVEIMCAYLSQDFDMEQEIAVILASIAKEDELIVLVDVYGGSVANAFSARLFDTRVHVITGVNFPMVLEMVMRPNDPIEVLIKEGMKAAKEGIIYVNEILQKSQMKEEDF